MSGFWLAHHKDNKDNKDKGFTFESSTPVVDLSGMLSQLTEAAANDDIELADLCICYFTDKAAAANRIAEIGEENIQEIS